MDTAALYNTFTRPKVVTSMLLVGIGLGLALSLLISYFRGQWFLPAAFTGLAFGTAILYVEWLDRQESREEHGFIPAGKPSGDSSGNLVLIRPQCPLVITGTAVRFAFLSDPLVIGSMFLLCIGLGLILTLVIILFRETWFLPALIAALTIGTVAAYLCWLDRRDLRKG